MPYLTWGILAVNVLVFLYMFLLPEEQFLLFLYKYAAIPAVITGQLDLEFVTTFPAVFSLLTSMFLHGGFWHLLGNMVFLYVFSDNVESILGYRKFLFFYIACGVAATLGHIISNPGSEIPMVGASGAISGIMAGYMLKYPAARIHVIVFIFPIVLPAALVVGLWFAMQLLNGFVNLDSTGSGVAWFAHIGGFIAGAVLMSLISGGRFYWIKR